MPQRPYTPSAEDRELVEILVAGGITERAICRLVKNADTNEGIGLTTLRKYFAVELEMGRELANGKLVAKAYQMAEAGNPTMLIFLLKVRMGYKEPAQEVNLHQTYGQMLEEAHSVPREVALKLVHSKRTEVEIAERPLFRENR